MTGKRMAFLPGGVTAAYADAWDKAVADTGRSSPEQTVTSPTFPGQFVPSARRAPNSRDDTSGTVVTVQLQAEELPLHGWSS